MKSAEKILNTKKGLKQEGIKTYIEFDEAIQAMKEYASQLQKEISDNEKMKEILIKFAQKHTFEYQSSEAENLVDEYLKHNTLHIA